MRFRLLALILASAISGLPLPAEAACPDCDGDGFQPPVDCNDADAAVYPGAGEPCDGFDSDCNGMVDDAPACEGVCVTLARDGNEALVSSGSAASQQPALAWTGSEHGVAWRDSRDGNNEIYFARVSAAGVKLSSDLRITSDSAASSRPALAWTGEEYGLAWVENRDGNNEIYFRRLDAAGAPIGGETRLTEEAADSNQPALAWTGSEFLIAWRDDRDGNREIYRARVSRTGGKVGGDMRLTAASGASEQPALAWSGAGAGVAWTDERDGNREIYFATLDAAAARATSDSRVSVASAASESPALAWNGAGYGVAWVDERDGNREIYFAALDGGGEVAATWRLTTDGAESVHPSLAWTGFEYGVAWRDTRVLNGEIFMARVSPAAAKLGGDLRVSSDLGLLSREPAVVWTGSGFGLVWSSVEINFGRVSCDCPMGDEDGDGFSACRDCDDASTACTTACIDADQDGVAVCAGDCEDAQAAVYPGAAEVCDGFRNDCLAPGWPSTAGTNESDDDGDGTSECAGDCDDTRAAVHAGGTQSCDGRNNDCGHAAWPGLAGTNEADDDGDGSSECAGDCDDSRTAVRPGGAQVCDGLNNDCGHPSWPGLAGTNESDDDGDGLSVCDDDCNDAIATVWRTPGEVRDLTLAPLAGAARLDWAGPEDLGGTAVVYDVIRSGDAGDFLGPAASCVMSNGTSLTLDDPQGPPAGSAYHYLVRAENGCPVGQGPLGLGAEEIPRQARSCP